MKILIVGSGGREHALAWKIKQSKKVKEIFVAPGNGGTEKIATNINLNKTSDIIKWAKKNEIDLVIVGQDCYLKEGIVDKLNKVKIKTFGPTKKAARIEWSKAFAKKFMLDNAIPTAKFKTFSNYKGAFEYIKKQAFPVVVKADGLAFGKGVTIIDSVKNAEKILKEIFVKKVFGTAGACVVIEEFIQGKEISVHAFCDGKDFSIFPISKDHKKIYDGNSGPNTGGMGTVAPIISVSKKEIEEIKNKVIIPTIKALSKIGNPFKGILFPGIFLTKDGPKVIEFNARFGDPETQSYMRLLKTDLIDICLSCIEGKLKKQKIAWSKEFACCVICSSGGYPGKYKTGFEISGLDNFKENEGIVFHAGTKSKNGKVLTNGGRVLGVSAIGGTLQQALNKSYKVIEKINYKGKYFRKDINK